MKIKETIEVKLTLVPTAAKLFDPARTRPSLDVSILVSRDRWKFYFKNWSTLSH